MATNLTLKELAEHQCPHAWAWCQRYREIASGHHSLPKKCRIALEPRIKAAAKHGYEDLKLNLATHIPTKGRYRRLIAEIEQLPIHKRKETLRNETYREAEKAEINEALAIYRRASDRLRQRVAVRLFAILQSPDVVITARDATGTFQRLERSVVLEPPRRPVTSRLRASMALVHDHPSFRKDAQAFTTKASEIERNDCVLDIEANTIAIRGIVWWAVSVTLPSSIVEPAVPEIKEEPMVLKSLYNWGVEVAKALKAENRRIGADAFAAVAGLRFGSKNFSVRDVEDIWPRLRRDIGWRGTAIPKGQRITENELNALLVGCGLLDKSSLPHVSHVTDTR